MHRSTPAQNIALEESLYDQQTAPSAARIVTPTNRLRALISSLRPRQWTKNLTVFVGIIFSQHLFILVSLARATLACLAFCCASSFVYVLNDIHDRENDKLHPIKRKRPIASGALPVSWALALMAALLLACGGFVELLHFLPEAAQFDIFADLGGSDMLFGLAVLSYIGIMILYSIYLKHIVLIDVFIIAGGFVIRVLAGVVVIPVFISPWLYLVTILLALFLALNKRRHEITLLEEQAGSHRRILIDYSLPMLDQLITIVAAATVISYSLYTFQGTTGNHGLMVTIPFILYGMFRYLYLVHMRQEGGNPEEVLLHDRHILSTVTLCVAIVMLVLYVFHL
jgi:4-hydroxybenzoate polyprenyltransferase